MQNPGPRLDICLNEGVYDFVFHQKTYQFKPNMAISPSKHLNTLAQNYPWRAMLIDYHDDLALLYTNETGWGAPVGAFPMWSVSQPIKTLVRMLDNYPEDGEVVGTFTGSGAPAVAAAGQERRIVLCNFPTTPTTWESVFRDLVAVKRDHPEFIFHFHGQKSINRTLATGVDSFDHPVTLQWDSSGQPMLLLANGAYLDHDKYLRSGEHRKWAKLVGIDVRSIFDAPDRNVKSRRMYSFNLRSLKWSFANYDKVWSMRVVDESDVDPNDPDSTWIPVDVRYRPQSSVMTDKVICDVCSISHRCPFFRPGAICIVDDSESKQLAENFKSRNARDIVDALGVLVAAQGNRAATALAAEQKRNQDNPDEQKFSPEVTKMLTGTFEQGVTLARLLDPHLGVAQRPGGRGRRTAIEATASEVGGATPQELAAGFIKELDSAGRSIQDLTPDEAKEFLARIIPSGTMPPDVDDDAPPANGHGGNPVASGTPAVRATPRFNT